MKAKNNKDVVQAIVRFSIYLLVSIVIAVGSFSLFIKTASVEVNGILAKTGDYDVIQMSQIRLSETMDTVYHYTTLLNSQVGINHAAMYNVLSNRTLRLNNELENMNPADCLLYKKLAGQISSFFAVKDSIKRANADLDVLRDEYLRCVTRNKELSRQLYSKGIY